MPVRCTGIAFKYYWCVPTYYTPDPTLLQLKTRRHSPSLIKDPHLNSSTHNISQCPEAEQRFALHLFRLQHQITPRVTMSLRKCLSCPRSVGSLTSRACYLRIKYLWSWTFLVRRGTPLTLSPAKKKVSSVPPSPCTNTFFLVLEVRACLGPLR